MPVKIFLKTTVGLTSVIGLVLLIFPGIIGSIFLTTYAPGTDIFIRFLGSSLIGYSYLNYYTSKYKDPLLMHATLVGNFATLVIALLISIIGVIDHSLKSSGVLIILLHLTIGLGFGYYLYEVRSKNKSKIF